MAGKKAPRWWFAFVVVGGLIALTMAAANIFNSPDTPTRPTPTPSQSGQTGQTEQTPQVENQPRVTTGSLGETVGLPGYEVTVEAVAPLDTLAPPLSEVEVTTEPGQRVWVATATVTVLPGGETVTGCHGPQPVYASVIDSTGRTEYDKFVDPMGVEGCEWDTVQPRGEPTAWYIFFALDSGREPAAIWFTTYGSAESDSDQYTAFVAL